MIYFDNAATTYPKPPRVISVMAEAQRTKGANPGRSGHKLSLLAAQEVYNCRQTAAELFSAPGPECVAFTLNCTMALNMVIKGVLKPGDHVVTSNLEHNAVMRPLQALADQDITFTQAQVVPGNNNATVDHFRQALRPNTALIVCMHASNVWGIRLPVERIAALGREYQIPTAVDCAQSAGVLPINLEDNGIDYLCMAGHKGLYGPMGTGMLIAKSASLPKTILEGGTGTSSFSFLQPDQMPEQAESGTPNLPGIAGLRAGMEFVRTKTEQTIFSHEMRLVQQLYDGLTQIRGVRLYTQRPEEMYFAPVLSFNIEGMSSEQVAGRLDAAGIAVRPGLHCAPAAHQFMGTLEQGAVRVSPSAFNNRNEIERFFMIIRKINADS
ncbi:aminotransferase class V-fold PLP-dependent enzyme [Faecalispora anaeroviscerum]|uniref:aminotransferase class V-fold PLP-dependent enzyme n=1 Tax=Faecalispora anaeroviscerum TaxID=2991836 RepID=UPI0024BBBE71|nr:aminotransferase class V-fold PLP-dependent enzyme [Faecalispora anaeroviscerum]